MRRYSIIIFTEPSVDISLLLEGLARQSLKPFEVIIVEHDNAAVGEQFLSRFGSRLTLRFFSNGDSGTGYSRNLGFDEAGGDYFIVFDAHCEIGEDYLRQVDLSLNSHYLDAFVGTVQAKERASLKEKAIAYAMNVLYAVESWKGKLNDSERLNFRSFNFGLSKAVFEKTKGYLFSEYGEDTEFGLRIRAQGFQLGVVKEAVVYHLRICNLRDLFYDMCSTGKGRVNVYRFFPKELKPIHFLPSVFLLACVLVLPGLLIKKMFFLLLLIAIGVFGIVMFADAVGRLKRIVAALYSIPAVFVALWGYGAGFIAEMYKELSGTKKKV